MNCTSKAQKCVKKRHVCEGRLVVRFENHLTYPKVCIKLHNVISRAKINAVTLHISSN